MAQKGLSMRKIRDSSSAPVGVPAHLPSHCPKLLRRPVDRHDCVRRAQRAGLSWRCPRISTRQPSTTSLETVVLATDASPSSCAVMARESPGRMTGSSYGAEKMPGHATGPPAPARLHLYPLRVAWEARAVLIHFFGGPYPPLSCRETPLPQGTPHQ